MARDFWRKWLDVLLFRDPSRTSSEGPPHVFADPELELTGSAKAATWDGVLRFERPGLTAWRGHPSGDVVWLEWDRGKVTVKNPDEPTIAKTIVIASRLAALVVGDDGEVYEAAGKAPRAGRLSFADRWAAWTDRWRLRRAPETPAVPFHVGDRVTDAWGHEGEVVFIDLTAEHGLGVIRIRLDDGRERRCAAVAHGLRPL